MCGRFTLAVSEADVGEFFDLAGVAPDRAVAAPLPAPRYNIVPTQPVLAVRTDPQGGRRAVCRLRWGLIPRWAKDPDVGYRMINARAETVANKPAFRTAFRDRRCLIPADGFYEWQKMPGQKRKQPFYIRMREGLLFAFAGLWERWDAPHGEPVESCTIITTTPNDLLRPLHDRMPVILPPDRFAPWLDRDRIDGKGLEELEALLTPYQAELMTAFPVRTLVNNPSVDSPQCIVPLDE